MHDAGSHEEARRLKQLAADPGPSGALGGACAGLIFLIPPS